MTAPPNAANAELFRRIWRGFIGQFNWSGAWRTYIETYAEAIDADADRAHAHGARDADRVLALVRVATAQARALAWNWPGLVDCDDRADTLLRSVPSAAVPPPPREPK
jgi:hypothetical protein